MKIEVRGNVRITLELTPENELEVAAVAMMLTRHEKGAYITISRGESGGSSIAVSVDK